MNGRNWVGYWDFARKAYSEARDDRGFLCRFWNRARGLWRRLAHGRQSPSVPLASESVSQSEYSQRESLDMPLTVELVKALLGAPSAITLDGTTLDRYRTLRPLFRAVAAETKIPAPLLEAIAWTESHFKRDAVNPESGAAGLMQIMPFHFKRFGWNVSGTEWKQPLENIRAGAQILEDHGLGKRPINIVLAGYGGFVTKNPNDYIDKILTRASYLTFRYGI